MKIYIHQIKHREREREGGREREKKREGEAERELEQENIPGHFQSFIVICSFIEFLGV